MQSKLIQHQTQLRDCKACPEMIGPVITGTPVVSRVMLIGQAPGDREGDIGRPFAWTAGKTLFKWFASQGIDEERFRESVYIASVCRCFPGKKPKGGDRVPNPQEIAQCSEWMSQEFKILKPRLIILVGKLAISQFLPLERLTDVIGLRFEREIEGEQCTLIPLPHPSGASTWHRKEPGISLLNEALNRLGEDPEWQALK
ncbi:uracil-DNA glycosylase family protein [Leucothrix mucor]|uniref:uracil-DNA glycosylase family protein n=1 Tax=Leucothrix mucor TaxID=45248 RepID=UPI0003B51671|nr:uracil-DNA glycosylase family protein [Leucothrix mucor]